VQDAIKVSDSKEILRFVDKDDQIIALDEVQFFDNGIAEVVRQLLSDGKKVIAAGLDLDFKAQPFGSMPELLCMADKVDKLSAICMKCGSEYANRTQRLVNGEPADVNSPLIMIGGDETYEARCTDCYELPDRKSAFKRFKLLSGGLKNNMTEEQETLR
jgi:thymidine kinase